MGLRERYRPIALASNMLVASSFFVLLALLFANRGLTLVNVAIGCAIILIGNLLFVGSGIVVPSLVAPGRIVFPVNLTLPVVFCAWMAVVAYLSWRIGNPLEPTLDIFRRFAELFEITDLIWFPIAQIATMTAAAAINSRSPAPQGVDSD